jgi:hypothetical protein
MHIEEEYNLLAQNTSSWAVKRMLKKPNWTSTQVHYFSRNTNDEAVNKLIKGEIEVDWDSFSANTHPRAVDHLGENLDKVCWMILNANSSAGRLLVANKLTHTICTNTSDEAMELLDNNPKYINLYLLVSNSNPRALEIIKKYGYMTQISSPSSSIILNNLAKNTNPEAIKLLIDNLEYFQWRGIWSNPSPAAHELIEACLTKTWKKYCLFQHPDVIKKIEKNITDAKDWIYMEMHKNPNTCVLDLFDLIKYL